MRELERKCLISEGDCAPEPHLLWLLFGMKSERAFGKECKGLYF